MGIDYTSYYTLKLRITLCVVFSNLYLWLYLWPQLLRFLYPESFREFYHYSGDQIKNNEIGEAC